MSRTLHGGRLAELLGTTYPVVQGPYGGGLSSVALAAAVADAGGLGSFGAHHLPPERITDLVASLRAATDGPFAVNLWVPQPAEAVTPTPDAWRGHVDRLRDLYDEFDVSPPDAATPFLPDYSAQIEALLDAAPPVVSFVMGLPSADVVTETHRRGIVTLGTATTVAEAVAVQDAGLSAVVASGSDAGGHRGAFLRPVAESLVGTFALIPQVADAVRIPVIAAGGIADGRGVAAALTLGADGVQVGTGFLATTESGASDVHKAVLHSEAARTTVLTRLFSGRPARGVLNGLVRELAAAEGDVPAYPVQNALMAPIRAAAYARGDADRASLWAGQAASLSRAVPAADYLATLVADAEALLSR